MSQPKPATLESRLEQLESETRRNKFRTLALSAFLVAALGLLTWQILTPKTAIRVQRLVLVNDEGFEVGELVAGTAGGSLVLQTGDSMMAVLTAGERGAGLLIQDPSGPDISLLAGNQPYLFFGDIGSEEAVLLGMDRRYRPRLQIKDGTQMLGLGRLEEAGGLMLRLQGPEGGALWEVP